MKSFLLALSFLTRIPMPFIKEIASERQMASCLTFFPVVGLFIGLIVAITDSVTSRLFNISVASALDLVLLFAVTGGLHTDGLMDTVDGMLSGKAKDKMLEIMKDSRVGALGASAAILTFILKFALLAALTEKHRFAALMLFPSFGRWAIVPGIVFFPYARRVGLGKSFWSHSGRKEFLAATFLALAFAIILFPQRGALALLAAGTASLLMSKLSTRTLGGLTGDVYGAINELAEVAALMVFAAM